MSHRTASQPKTWGPAGVITVVVLGATAVGILAGTTLFWITVTDNPAWTLTTIGRFLAWVAVAADVQFMWVRGRRLYRSYRGQS